MNRFLLPLALSLLTACTAAPPMPTTPLTPDSQALTSAFTALSALNDNAYLATLATQPGSGAHLQTPEPATFTGNWARTTWDTLGAAPVTVTFVSAYHLPADVTAQAALTACQQSARQRLSCAPTLQDATHATLARHGTYTLLILAQLERPLTTQPR